MDWIPEEWFTALEWLQERETLFVWIGGFSLGILIISAVTVPVIIRRLPSDYFVRKSARDVSDGHPLLRCPSSSLGTSSADYLLRVELSCLSPLARDCLQRSSVSY